MKILLIGGAGFIGKNYIEKYSDSNEIYVVDSLDPLIHGFDLKNINNFLSLNTSGYLISDYASNESFEYIQKINPDIIITMASQTGTADGNNRVDYYLNENISKFSYFINNIKRLDNLRRVVHLSTRAVYGNGYSLVNDELIHNGFRDVDRLNSGVFKFLWEDTSEGLYQRNDAAQSTAPVSIYGVTKLAQEGLLSSLRSDCTWDYVILRLQNVIGRGQSLLNPYTGLTCWFTQAALSGKNIQIYENGEIWRDFIDVRDVCETIQVASINCVAKNEIIDIGSGVATNLVDYANLITSKVNAISDIELVKKYRHGDIRWAAANIDKAKSIGLYFNRNTLAETIEKFVDSVV